MSNFERLSPGRLSGALELILMDTSAFHLFDERDAWYHYFLAQLLPRSDEYMLELLVSCFFAMHPSGVVMPPYNGYLDDVLNTLGRCMMESRGWNGDDISVGSMLLRSNDLRGQSWFSWDASGDFSASMYFCLKYLPSSLIQDWFASVLAIRSPHWRARVLVWLVGSHAALRGDIASPSAFPAVTFPSVAWEGSHCLGQELVSYDRFGPGSVASFLPTTSRETVLAVTRRYFAENVLDSWLESVSQVPYLESELADIPSTFERLYVVRPNR